MWFKGAPRTGGVAEVRTNQGLFPSQSARGWREFRALRGRSAKGIDDLRPPTRAFDALSPWQSPYVERVIGSIRRECLDSVVVLHERHLRRILREYFAHYHRWRCHKALRMDCPEPRRTQVAEEGAVVEVTEAGVLLQSAVL